MTYTFARRNAGEYNKFRLLFAVLGLLVCVVSGSEKQVDRMVKAITGVSPWAVNKYTPKWEADWLEDRAKFLATVDKRKIFQQFS